jgi:hypothetical protein
MYLKVFDYLENLNYLPNFRDDDRYPTCDCADSGENPGLGSSGTGSSSFCSLAEVSVVLYCTVTSLLEMVMVTCPSD